MPVVRIGCSGFSYSHWKGVFYPEGLPRKDWFNHYCRHFPTVELNVTFYRLPVPAAFDRWRDETPSGFSFSLKGSRFITHIKRLSVTEESLEMFFSNALRLQEKLKVVLWQMPPSFSLNTDRLKKFLDLLKRYPVRNALEFRHQSWITDSVIDICGEHNAGLCMADWPEFIDELPVTSDFVYIRRHGRQGRYDSCYTKTGLRKDAKRIKGYLKDGRDVFLYFNNDSFGYAPRNAQELREML